jgi:N-acetyltransferase
MSQVASRASALDGYRVRLEPLGLEHVDGLCAVGLDAELWRWTPAAIRSRDEMRDYVQAALDAAAQGGCLPYVIMERAAGTVVGSTRITALDLEHRRCSCSWRTPSRSWDATGSSSGRTRSIGAPARQSGGWAPARKASRGSTC